jgi:putative tryptophan/tyrosine transport system substrate-binding protein
MHFDQLKRRDFITLLGGAAAAWPIAARAQQTERVRWIGMMLAGPESDPAWQANAAAFREALDRLGWKVGRNLAIEYRWRMNDVERTRAAAADLLALTPDVIVANGSPAVRALQQATRTIPIVFTIVNEPVAQGFVASLANPGGNTTGFTNLEPTVGAKWLELLKELAPRIARVAVMFNPIASTSTMAVPHAEAAAKRFGVELIVREVREPAEIETVMTMLGRDAGTGLICPTDSFINANRKPVTALAARHRVPAIYSLRQYATDGGLVSYGVDLNDQYRKAALYADRILRGTKPADLPVQQPTKYELVINLKTAKALGLDVPDKLLVAADEVIE